uniref:G-protein coupled receptors family 1 profile domain-containing protein n=1 Tax=Strongyloides stercoralis TaxID=6248 RepID=A0A0K0E8R5_STRER
MKINIIINQKLLKIAFFLYFIFNFISAYFVSSLIKKSLSYKNYVYGCQYQYYCIGRIKDAEVLHDFSNEHYYGFTMYLFLYMFNGYVTILMLRNFKKYNSLCFISIFLSLTNQAVLIYLIVMYFKMVSIYNMYGLYYNSQFYNVLSIILIVFQMILNIIYLVITIILKITEN